MRLFPFIVFFTLVAAVLTVSGRANGQSVPAIASGTMTPPTPQQLFDRHNTAVGGKAAMATYRSIYIKATVTHSKYAMWGESKPWEWYRKKPNRFLLKGSAIGRVGFDGTYTFTTCGNVEGVLLEGPAAAPVREQADFYFAFLDLTHFKTADSVQATALDGRSVYQVRVVRKDDSIDTLYFDPATGYKVAETTHDFVDGMGERKETCYDQKLIRGKRVHYRVIYSDYQPYGKIRLPRVTQEQIAPGFFLTTTIDEVAFDTVDDAVFLLPFGLEMRLHP